MSRVCRGACEEMCVAGLSRGLRQKGAPRCAAGLVRICASHGVAGVVERCVLRGVAELVKRGASRGARCAGVCEERCSTLHHLACVRMSVAEQRGACEERFILLPVFYMFVRLFV